MGFHYCNECHEELTPNSAVYDGYGEPDYYCTNPDCPNNPINHDDT